MSKIASISIALLLMSSCSSALRVSPLRCENDSRWHLERKNRTDASFSFEREVSTNWFFGDPKRLRLDKYFEEEGILCESVTSMKVEIREEFSDVFSSLFFLPTKQIIVTGTHIASSDDDDRVLSIDIKED